MGYFSDLDYRMRTSGISPERLDSRAPRCSKCGERMTVVGLGARGAAVEYVCTRTHSHDPIAAGEASIDAAPGWSDDDRVRAKRGLLRAVLHPICDGAGDTLYPPCAGCNTCRPFTP